MVYGRNLRGGMVVNLDTTGWGVVDRAVPFGRDNAHADVWMVGSERAVAVRLATAARLTPALRSAAAQARSLWAEVKRLRVALDAAEQERDQARAALEAAAAVGVPPARIPDRRDGVQDRPSRLRQPLDLGMPPAGIPTPDSTTEGNR